MSKINYISEIPGIVRDLGAHFIDRWHENRVRTTAQSMFAAGITAAVVGLGLEAGDKVLGDQYIPTTVAGYSAAAGIAVAALTAPALSKRR